MKKLSILLFGVFLLLFTCAYLIFEPITSTKAATHDVSLSTTVLTYLAFDITAGDTVSFGDLTPGTPIAAPATSTIASVTTNAANGYTLGVHDGSGTNSALRHTDESTYIADYAGTIGTPTTWTDTGLGITVWTGDHAPAAKWCADTCSTYDDTDNKYAGVPETATTIHTVTGKHDGADTTSCAFKIDVPNTQKTGSYSGNVTFTATAVLS